VSGLRPGLDVLYFSGIHALMRPVWGGVGAILALHHVRPPRPDAFQPNRRLEVTPQFLESMVRTLRRSNLDLVSLDEMHRRMTQGDFRRRFVALTFDDGYRDTKTWALPILRRYGVPFAVFVATGFADRIGELWWLALERVIAKTDRIALLIEDEDLRIDCGTLSEKRAAFDAIRARLRRLPTDEAIRTAMRDLAARYAVDMAGICREVCMTWSELAELARDPLVTIGAHTVNHVVLAKVSAEEVQAEIGMSRTVIQSALGVRCEHLSYPFGDAAAAGPREFRIAAELGFKTAATARAGVLFRRHAAQLTALPRLSVDGEHQRLRYVKVLLSGSATPALADRRESA
jgi:peptidoglycan/xylan/chitin deacetylase (PgdA/CDA1 family)